MPPKRKRPNSDGPKRRTKTARTIFGKQCSICGDIIPKGLAQHEGICKLNRSNRQQALEYTAIRQKRASTDNVSNGAGSSRSLSVGLDLPLQAPRSPTPEPMDTDPSAAHVEAGPQLPMRFIYVKHHPHAHKLDEIIPLDADAPQITLPVDLAPSSRKDPFERPWAPFRCLADSTFAYRCVSRRTSNKEIDDDLKRLHGEWADNVHITFRNHRDLDRALDAAREGNVRFHTRKVNIPARGQEFSEQSYDVEIEFRDPWEVTKRLVRDETLASVSTWFSQKRYLCTDGAIELSNPLYDEPWTAETWGEIDDCLPANDRYPSCYLGGHIWLDKGLVSTKVKMHPILWRGCWIQSATRNGSGNGGATLLGFVKMPPALRDIDARTLRGTRRAEYDRLKREIYHTVCMVVLASLEPRSRNGEALRFGDGVTRIAYPGILVESMDFEELAAWLAIRNSRANHPCPKCLVYHDDLHKLSVDAELRTSASMRRIFNQAKRLPPTQREELLKSYGLQFFELFLWRFDHLDPYDAAGYDLLHYFDSGIWGKHVWPRLVEYLQTEKLASKFNDNMSQFPRWRGLKHTPSPTTIDYSDGQTYVDILKSSLACLVQLLPRNSPFIRILRIMNKVRIMLGLPVTTKTRLDHLDELVCAYENACGSVYREFDKDFNFLKQHFLKHARRAFTSKGTSRNMNTRVGEGFQQEVAKMYDKTNGKKCRASDEKEEAMARIQMAVDEWVKSQKDSDIDESERELIPQLVSTAHWTLGSADRTVSVRRIEAEKRGDPSFRNFEMRLREYIARHHPTHSIKPCKVVYLDYQSKVDWRSARDILRCNPKFHNAPRFDSVIYDTDIDPLAMGQLQLLFRVHLSTGAELDLAMIRPFCGSLWKPKTATDCPVRERAPSAIFIALEHVVRGVLLSPIFGARPEKYYYVIDCIDEDMYLRVNNID
ncbi:hypothetical protein B0H15DRAFT_905706 [Mycena belliarum]|uniref:Uncharacterized protein n=1 Tax=Mycena belliarum TaxID=1033014 RepID=A0AAD6U7H6_9AGAR|nr:hypothetical protein B0H15DRAFT_905706 [Mycena belliae]